MLRALIVLPIKISCRPPHKIDTESSYHANRAGSQPTTTYTYLTQSSSNWQI